MISLKSVKIEKFKSFKADQSVLIEPDVTILVGMNESGKTSFLKGLAKTRYFDDEDKDFTYDTTEDFPRNELRDFKKNEKDYKALVAEYEISESLLKKIYDRVGDKTLKYSNFNLYHSYKSENIFRITGKVDESAHKLYVSHKYKLSSEDATIVKNSTSIKDILDKFSDREEKNIIALRTDLISIAKYNNLDAYIYGALIGPNIPKFWYFDDYYELKGKVNISELQSKKEHKKKTKLL